MGKLMKQDVFGLPINDLGNLGKLESNGVRVGRPQKLNYRAGR